MAQILVRDLSDETIQQLKDRAKRNGRTFAAEIEFILKRAAGIEGLPSSKEVKVLVTKQG